MLASVKKTREEILMKLGATQRIKPGTFLRPVEQLLRKQKVGSVPQTTRASTQKGIDEHMLKFLEKQNELNKEVLHFK